MNTIRYFRDSRTPRDGRAAETKIQYDREFRRNGNEWFAEKRFVYRTFPRARNESPRDKTVHSPPPHISSNKCSAIGRIVFSIRLFSHTYIKTAVVRYLFAEDLTGFHGFVFDLFHLTNLRHVYKTKHIGL